MNLKRLSKLFLFLFILISLSACSPDNGMYKYASGEDITQSELPDGAIPFAYKYTTLYSTKSLEDMLPQQGSFLDSVVVILNADRPLEGSLVQISELSGDKTGRILFQTVDVSVDGYEERPDVLSGYYFIDILKGAVTVWFKYNGVEYRIQSTLLKLMKIGGTIYIAANTLPIETAPPVANAGEDVALRSYGETVQLDSSASFSPDGVEITRYKWALEIPEGSAAVLDDATLASPSFVADVYGDYIATLHVYDATGAPSNADTVTYSLSNLPPVANAGNDIIAVLGDSVLLQGSGTDPEGEPLNYTWALLTSPVDSNPILSDENLAAANLYVDAMGSYSASLIVNDGVLSSDADSVDIEVISVRDGLTNQLIELNTYIASIPDSALKRKWLAKVLSKKLNIIVKMFNHEGYKHHHSKKNRSNKHHSKKSSKHSHKRHAKKKYNAAVKKLKHDIIAKTDGCIVRGKVDRNDYITDCSVQSEFYEMLIRIEELMTR